MKLSIITPAAPQRRDRITSIFHRLELNRKRNPDIEFEFLFSDTSINAEYQDLAKGNWSFPVKYVSLPVIDNYPSPGYMRNCLFRIAQGEIFTMIDVDHWVHEDFIVGATEPFKKQPCLNTGFMIDSSLGNKWQISIGETMLSNSKSMLFKDAMNLCGINGPSVCNRVWLAAYPRQTVLSINAYDEKYVAGYGREDDDIYYRLASKLLIERNYYETFAGLHIWHPQIARNDIKNELNKKYYNSISHNNPLRNINYEWGKLIRGAFTIIDKIRLNFSDHEIYAQTLGSNIYEKPWETFAQIRQENLSR